MLLLHFCAPSKRKMVKSCPCGDQSPVGTSKIPKGCRVWVISVPRVVPAAGVSLRRGESRWARDHWHVRISLIGLCLIFSDNNRGPPTALKCSHWRGNKTQVSPPAPPNLPAELWLVGVDSDPAAGLRRTTQELLWCVTDSPLVCLFKELHFSLSGRAASKQTDTCSLLSRRRRHYHRCSQGLCSGIPPL